MGNDCWQLVIVNVSEFHQKGTVHIGTDAAKISHGEWANSAFERNRRFE